MKIDNKILITLLIIGVLTFILMLYKEKNNYKKEALVTRNPFNEIKILNQKVDLNNKDRLYKNNIDCTSLRINEQILSYDLKKGKDNYKVSTIIKVYKDNQLLKDNYEDATNLETQIFIKDENNLYEQIFIVASTCQQGDIS